MGAVARHVRLRLGRADEDVAAEVFVRAWEGSPLTEISVVRSEDDLAREAAAAYVLPAFPLTVVGTGATKS